MISRICYLLLICFFSFNLLACKTNQIKNNLQEGKWVTVDTLDFLYIRKGRYHKGKETGTWRSIYNGKLDRKEKYRKNKCITKFYYPNGKVKQKGYTIFDINNKETHWYYSGDWQYYDENGVLTSIKTFEKGKIIKQNYIVDSILEFPNKKIIN